MHCIFKLFPFWAWTKHLYKFFSIQTDWSLQYLACLKEDRQDSRFRQKKIYSIFLLQNIFFQCYFRFGSLFKNQAEVYVRGWNLTAPSLPPFASQCMGSRGVFSRRKCVCRIRPAMVFPWCCHNAQHGKNSHHLLL